MGRHDPNEEDHNCVSPGYNCNTESYKCCYGLKCKKLPEESESEGFCVFKEDEQLFKLNAEL